MIVYELDENDFFIGFNDLTEDNQDTLNYTTVPMTVGYYKPKFNKETQEWFEGATQEEIEEIKRQEEENKPVQEPSKIEILEAKINEMQENQLIQNLLIDDIVFEVIPTLEHQIKLSDDTILNLNSMLTKIDKTSGGMANYLAKNIFNGRSYDSVFNVNCYKIYQNEVDKLLLEMYKNC